MSAIYKCCSGSELKEVLAVGVVAKGSVEHDLKGKHHKRGFYCTSFTRQTVLLLVQHLNSLSNNQFFIQVEDTTGEIYFLACNVHAVHARNWDEFLGSLYAMYHG